MFAQKRLRCEESTCSPYDPPEYKPIGEILCDIDIDEVIELIANDPEAYDNLPIAKILNRALCFNPAQIKFYGKVYDNTLCQFFLFDCCLNNPEACPNGVPIYCNVVRAEYSMGKGADLITPAVYAPTVAGQFTLVINQFVNATIQFAPTIPNYPVATAGIKILPYNAKYKVKAGTLVYACY